MSKYFCKKCAGASYVIDFSRKSKIIAVYARCDSCNIEAWGGIDFHPAMNEVFNMKFDANYDFDNRISDLYKINSLDH